MVTINEIKEKLDRPVVLIGMMGSGKSHAGEILSALVDIPLYDCDRLIEAEQGATIAQIFETNGEIFFRKAESEMILSLLQNGPCVISTGGGAVTNPTVLNAIKEYAFSIWLMSDIPVILKRIENDGARPLLNVPDKAAKLEDILKSRKRLYAQADIKIENNDENEGVLKDKLHKALYEFLNLR